MADDDGRAKRDRRAEIGALLLGVIFLAAGLFSLYLAIDADFRESLPGLVFKGDPFWSSVVGAGLFIPAGLFVIVLMLLPNRGP